MKRTSWKTGMQIAAILIALSALGLGPQHQAAAAGGTYTSDFEQGLKPWAAGSGSLLTLDYSDNLCPMELGTGMALLTLPIRDAIPGGALAYMMASFPANPGDTVVVDWAARPEGTCITGACVPLISTGVNTNPATFNWTTAMSQQSIYGWRTYHYQGVVPVDAVPAGTVDGRSVVIAFGLAAKGPLTGVSLGIDCVRVTILANTD